MPPFDDDAQPPTEVLVGAHALVEETDLSVGDRCPAGGKALRSGTDADGDGRLLGDEVVVESVLCHGEHGAVGPDGADGSLVVTRRTELTPGDDCAGGGWRVAAGVDEDEDGDLSETEVDDEYVVCHGAASAIGPTLGALSCAEAEVPAFIDGAWSCAPLPSYDGADFALSSQGCPPGLVAVGFSASGTLVCEPPLDTLASLSCAPGQVAKWSGSAWSCGADTTTTAGSDTLTSLACADGELAKWSASNSAWECGNDVDTDADTDTDTLATLTCTDGQLAKWSESGWSCGADDTPAAGADTLLSLSCGDGEVAKWSATNSAWECGVDIDTDTDTDTLLALSCTAGQVAKWSGADGWSCGDDIDTDTDTDTNTDTLLDLSSSCATGELAKWDGASWGCAADNDQDTDTDTLAALSCADGQVAKWNQTGNVWACGDDVDTDTDTNTDTLASLGCPTAGHVPKWSGSTWECAPDVDTDSDTDTLASLGCTTAGHVPRWSGSAWECATDADTDTDTLAALGCTTAGHVPKWSGIAWECATDADTDTDTDVLAALSCADGQLARWSQSSGAWECAADVDTDTDTLTTLGCTTAGHVPKWSGSIWECSPDVDTNTNTDTLAALSCSDGQLPKWSDAATAWACAVDDSAAGGGDGVFTTTIVIGGGATPQDNGSLLLSALAGLTDASATSPYLIKLEPGVYDMQTDNVPMRPYVDIEGSGRGVTTILSANTSAAVTTRPNTALRDLAVEVTSTGIALSGTGEDFTLERVSVRKAAGGTAARFVGFTLRGLRLRDVDVTIDASGADCIGVHIEMDHFSVERTDVALSGCPSAKGLVLYGPGEVTDADVTIRDGGFSASLFRGIEWGLYTGQTGRLDRSRVSIRSAAATDPEINALHLRVLSGLPLALLTGIDIEVTAANTTPVYGLVSAAVTKLRRSRIEVSSSAGPAFGAQFFEDTTVVGTVMVLRTPGVARGILHWGPGRTLAMTHSTIEAAPGAASPSFGVFVDNATLRLDGVVMRGDLDRGVSSNNGVVSVGASQLGAATAVFGTGTLTCVASYDATYAALPAGCQ